MQVALDSAWGNPSSIHSAGRAARDAVERARAEVAALCGVSPEEIVFTSGGSEGNHLAIMGLLGDRPVRGMQVLSSPIEHPSIPMPGAQGEGGKLGWIAVDPAGRIDQESYRRLLAEPTTLVSLAAANHEIGNVYPIAELAQAAHAAGAVFHADAVQAVGRTAIDVGATGVDAATISSHKIGGPQGVGAVFLRRGVPFRPVGPGGHQERDRRPGTENVPGIVGFGAAAAAARRDVGAAARVAGLRLRLEKRLLAIPRSRLHGDPEGRGPGTINVGFEGARGEHVVAALDLEGVCVSTGAACTSGSVEPSPVLLALGLSPGVAREAVRLSLGWATTEGEVDEAARIVERVVERVRSAAW